MTRKFLIHILVIILSILVIGCSAGVKSAKKNDPKTQPNGPANQEQQKVSENAQSPDDPKYAPPGPSESDKLIQGGVDPKERAEINQSALEFAQKNVPNVKHIKTCYSKLYGGWYMLLYLEKGKKLSMQHWSWNSKTKEWEIVYNQKELSPKQLDFDLKGEVSGEKCFILK